MIEQYEPFCLADPRFFELPERRDDSADWFGKSLAAAPQGWARADRGTAVVMRPEGAPLPSQGWKIHVSATREVAEDVLDRTWDHCVARKVAFKFLRSAWALQVANFKYADRGASGKFVTIYPRDADQFGALLEELGAVLDGSPGPRVLSDIRWRSGPLYARYGGFVERHCLSASGEPVPAIQRPDGELVPDVRTPFFQPPAWVELPPCLAGQQAEGAGDAAPPDDFPYRVEGALHFSNSGGVYSARDSTGRRVVLKEARPCAGLDLAGRDAVARLRTEREALLRLADHDFVPGVLDWRVWGGHEFLVMEHVEGESLHSAIARRHPLAAAEATAQDVATYTEWALDVLEQVGRHLSSMHSVGLAYCDLHPRNVLVREDGRTSLVDLELTRGVDDRCSPPLGAPGFCTPAARTGREADRYAFACLQLAVFMPMTALLNRHPDSARTLVNAVASRFPVPSGFIAEIRDGLGLAADPESARPRRPEGSRRAGVSPTSDPSASDSAAPDPVGLREAIVTGILAVATPERNDRLYPGDVAQFRYGGYGLAYGAAGVLLAMARAGVEPPPEHVDWMVAAALRDPAPRGGLYDGLPGVAYVLDHLGRTDALPAVLDRSVRLTHRLRTETLFGGLAGAGLFLLHFARRLGDRSLLQRASAAAGRLADAGQGRAAAGDMVPLSQPGLMHGWSGPALLFARLYEHTGDTAWLDEAALAIGRDRGHATTMDDGRTYLADSAGVVRPFLAQGSAGLGLVLDRYLSHREDEELAGLRAGLHLACRPELVTEPGLFDGRAGLLHYLAQAEDADGTAQRSRRLDLQLRRLSWHAVPLESGTGFPGRGLLRLSTDLATGSAGVLLALASLESGAATLPFLDPPPSEPTNPRDTRGGDQP